VAVPDEERREALEHLVVGEIPIEAKVLYPESTAADAGDLGLGQSAQYAARSGFVFLAVLDMRSRTDSADLSQIANDVSVRDVVQSDGPTPVRIIRVQHVIGFGPPSRASS
jgi:hypothetical protein